MCSIRSTTLMWLALTPLLPGCGNLGIGLKGHLPGAQVTLAADRSLAFTTQGTQKINGRRLRLPHAGETLRFGVRFVDAGRLPKAWRPEHAKAGGILVARIDRASPLAIQGLRPMDRVRTIDGQAVTDVEMAAAALRAVPASRAVTLEIVTRDGDAKTISAAAHTELNETSETHIPLLFHRVANQHESAASFGPLEGLFWYSRTLRDRARDYHRRVRWGTLLNLISWQSTHDPATEKTTRTLRLLWVIPITF